MSVTRVIDEKYEIHREIKRGGFGLIYEGVDLTFGKPIAIKAVDPNLLGEAKYIDMFQAEALNIAQFSHHNIVHIFDIKRDPTGQFYIIMEFIDGPDLGTLIKECNSGNFQLPLHLGLYIIAEACAGLDYAHNRRDSQTNEPLNIVHQDISPSNIMITRSGEVKLIDFGMANLRRKQPKNKKEVVIQGKLNYIVPEMVKNSGQLDRRADIFALGLVLYEILTGERVIKQNTPEAVVNELIAGKLDLSGLENGKLPEKVGRAIQKALEINPDKRYPTANHFYMDLMHQLIVTAPTADFMTELSDFISKNIPEPVAATSGSFSSDGSKEIINGFQNIDELETTNFKAHGGRPFENEIDHDAESANEIEPLANGSLEEDAALEVDLDSAAQRQNTHENDIEHLSAPEENSQPASAALNDELALKEAPLSSEKADGDELEKQDIALAAENEEKAEEFTADAPDLEIDINDDYAQAIVTNDEKNEITVQTSEPDSLPGNREMTAESETSDSSFSPEMKFQLQESPEDEELKTIIDVVRLSTRNHKKAIISTVIAIFVLAVSYTVFDVMTQKTAFGVALYDWISPPAAKIDSYPSGAQVYLDDVLQQQRTPLRLDKIKPGIHKLKLVLPRFEPIVRSINVPGKGAVQIAGKSQIVPTEPFIFHFSTKLNIASTPPGADIEINGIRISSKTPTVVNWEISGEPIEIKMMTAGYPDLQGFSISTEDASEFIPDRRFWKFSRNDPVKDDFSVEGIFHKYIEIKSIPSRAQILINNSPVGISGINGEVALTPGKHEIRVRKKGYIDKRRTLEVSEKTTGRMTMVLSRKVRIFVKNSFTKDDNDINAKIVSLRGSGKTRRMNVNTPAEITLLPYTYAALLKKPGFKDKEVTIGRTQTNIVVRMDPIPAPVEIYIVDSVTNMVVEDVDISYKLLETKEAEKTLGSANEKGELFVELPPEMYQFTINKPGYQPVTKNLRVKSGRRNRLTFRFVTEN